MKFGRKSVEMAWGMAKRHEAAIHQLKNRILSLVTEQLAF